MTIEHVLGTMCEEKAKLCEKNSKQHLFGTFWDGLTWFYCKSSKIKSQNIDAQYWAENCMKNHQKIKNHDIFIFK